MYLGCICGPKCRHENRVQPPRGRRHGAVGGELWPWVSVPFPRLGGGKGRLSPEPVGRLEGALHPLPSVLAP